MEECVLILREGTIVGLHKGTEKLDEYVSTNLIEKFEEFKEKPYVLSQYLLSII